MNDRSTGGVPVGGGDFAGFIGFGLLIAVGWIVWSLFALSLALGVGAIAFIAVCAFLLTQLGELDGAQKAATATLLVLAIVGALLLYPLAIDNHIVSFALVGWTITGLFYAALITGAWIAASALARVLAMIMAAAAVAALVVLPTPGAGDPTDKASEWRITLTVLDEAGEPMHYAVTQCSALMTWDGGEGAVAFDHRQAEVTNEEGVATFTFHEDTRLKVAVCTALKESEAGPNWMNPTEENFARALYPPKSITLASPFPGGDYKLTLQLEPRKQGEQSARQ